MAKFYVVLDDDLLKEFLAFKHGKNHKSSLIIKLLHLHKPNCLSNKEQLDRIGFDNKSLISMMSSSNRFFNKAMSLTELAKETIYKIILSTENKPFPYVNINSTKLSNFYSITAQPTQDRENIKEYLRVLFENAKHITIYDNYFDYSEDSSKNCIIKRSVELLDLFPSTVQVTFEANPHNAIRTTCLKHIKQTYPKMQVSQRNPANYRNHHDRYILIDNKIEVIVTSGIDYIFNTNKECTIIIKEVTPKPITLHDRSF